MQVILACAASVRTARNLCAEVVPSRVSYSFSHVFRILKCDLNDGKQTPTSAHKLPAVLPPSSAQAICDRRSVFLIQADYLPKSPALKDHLPPLFIPDRTAFETRNFVSIRRLSQRNYRTRTLFVVTEHSPKHNDRFGAVFSANHFLVLKGT